MKSKILFLLIIGLSSISCQSNKEVDIIGSWTSSNVIDNTGMNITDKIEFNKDGSYSFTMYSNGDSIVSQLKGTYEVDKNNNTITINTNGISFQHKIIKIEEADLTIKTLHGVEMTMKRIN